jgi:putative flippase GtrA
MASSTTAPMADRMRQGGYASSSGDHEPGASHTGQPVVEVVVPVYNEERVLEANIRALRSYLDERFPFQAAITIADNASVDCTPGIADHLAANVPGVRAVHLPEKGRGRALRAVWSVSEAQVVAYMDVDLATDLDALLPLVAPLLSGHSDVAIGTRLGYGARVRRGSKREVISRAYNLIIRATMRSGFSDAQCGFKALRRSAAQDLLPLVADQGWFFDTELLILAEANGMRIHEVPVDWVDDGDSRVDVVSTATSDLKGLFRVAGNLARGGGLAPGRRSLTQDQAARFGGIGGMSTVAYLVLLTMLSPVTGILVANAVALTAAAIGNTAAHVRLTLPGSRARGSAGRRSRSSFAREVATSYLAGVGLSTAGLAAAAALDGGAAAYAMVALAVNALVSLGRFISFRNRMYRSALSGESLR